MFGRIANAFNRIAPKVTRWIGQVASISRNIGQGLQHVSNIGSTVNAMSVGRIGNSQLGRKAMEITNTIDNVANNVANQEGAAYGVVNTMG